MPATSVTTTMNDLNAVTNRHFVETTVKDARAIDSPTLRVLYDRRRKLPGGADIVFPLKYDRTPVQFYTAFEQFDTNYQQMVTEVRYNWRLVAATITLDEFTINRNGSDSVVKLAAYKLAEGKDDYINAVSHNLFAIHAGQTAITMPNALGGVYNIAAGDSARWEGLRQAIRANAAVHTYGGLASDTHTAYWNSYVGNGAGISDDNGTGGTARSLTVDLIRTALSNVNKGITKVDYCTMDDDAFDRLDALIFPQQRFTDPGMAELGFSHIGYRGCTFYPDPYMQEIKNPAGQSTLIFWNSELFFMVVHENKDMTWSGWMRPHDQEAFTGQISSMGNFVTINRARQGRLNNLVP